MDMFRRRKRAMEKWTRTRTGYKGVLISVAFIVTASFCDRRPDFSMRPLLVEEMVGSYVLWLPDCADCAVGVLRLRADGTYGMTMRDRETGRLLCEISCERWVLDGEPPERVISGVVHYRIWLDNWVSWDVGEGRFRRHGEPVLSGLLVRKRPRSLGVVHDADGYHLWSKVSCDPELAKGKGAGGLAP